jgi:hypothetical protein
MSAHHKALFLLCLFAWRPSTAPGQTQGDITGEVLGGPVRIPKIAKTDPKALEQLLEPAKQNATRAISIRVPIADLEHAQRIATATGVGYQVVLKRAIRAGLKRAG